MTEFPHISLDPGRMGGRACIKGTRVTVGMITGQIGAGRSIDDLLADYPYLTRDDVVEAMHYSAMRAQDSRFAK